MVTSGARAVARVRGRWPVDTGPAEVDDDFEPLVIGGTEAELRRLDTEGAGFLEVDPGDRAAERDDNVGVVVGGGEPGNDEVADGAENDQAASVAVALKLVEAEQPEAEGGKARRFPPLSGTPAAICNPRAANFNPFCTAGSSV